MRGICQLAVVLTIGLSALLGADRVQAQPVVTTFASGLELPLFIEFDRDGNLYVANNNGSSIQKISASGTKTTFVNGLSSPRGLAFDGAGNLYVSQIHRAVKYPPSGMEAFSLHWNFTGFWGIAFDTADNFYVASQSEGAIMKSSSTSLNLRFVTDLDTPQDLVLDESGNLYVAEYSTGTIRKITPDGANTPFATGLDAVYGLAFDDAGNLFASLHLSGEIRKISPAGVVDPTPVVTGLNGPYDLEFDASGNLYVSLNDNTISKIVLTPPPAAVPTLSEWAMILFGLGLAGGAALMIGRRKATA